MIQAERRSGIYQIRNIVNNKIYIGSAKVLFKRRTSHFKDLRAKTHHSSRLQNSFNKHGEANFIFEILEIVVEEQELLSREQFFLDTMKPHYNISPTAGRTTGIKRSDAFKQKMKELFYSGVTGRVGMKNSQEHRRRNSEWMKNNQHIIQTPKSIELRRLAWLGKPAWNKGTKGVMKAWNKGIKIWWGDKCTKKAHEASKKKVFLYDIKNDVVECFDSIKACRLHFGATSIQYYVESFRLYKDKYIISFQNLSFTDIKNKIV